MQQIGGWIVDGNGAAYEAASHQRMWLSLEAQRVIYPTELEAKYLKKKKQENTFPYEKSV